MAPASALNLTVSQEDVYGACDTSSIKAVADALLLALKTPLKLEWATQLECNGAKAAVKVSAELGAEANAWPPRKFTLSVIPSEPASDKTNLLSTYGFEVSSSISATQLAELLEVGSHSKADHLATATHCAGYMEKANPENITMTDCPTKDPALEVEVESASGSLQKRISELPLVDSDRSRCLSQPACLQQWHGNTCGHHAVFNIRCLLNGQPEKLQDYQAFWKNSLESIQLLALHGKETGRWPPSRVTKGVADDVHLRYLVETDETLCGRVSFVQSSESLVEQLEDSDSEMSLAIRDVVSGHSQAHGFMLGATNHWYAAVAIAAPPSDDASGRSGETRLIFCDSYNLPLVKLQNVQDVEELADKLAQRRREKVIDKLRLQPEWEHRPMEHLHAAFEEGVPEWWKGIKKASPFWREQPLEVWMHNKKEELDRVRSYLHSLSQALGSTIEEPNCV